MENDKKQVKPKRTKFEQYRYFAKLIIGSIFGIAILYYFYLVTFKPVVNEGQSNLIVGSLITAFSALIGFIVASEINKPKEEKEDKQENTLINN